MADFVRNRDESVNGTKSALKPIAIVGIGCRFPGGANSPAAFWELLKHGVDAVTEVPSDRWTMQSFFDPDPKTPGKMYSRWGGFLEHIDRFDAQFFRIAPREAMYMDPQQRLLLEVCWEALEDGGQDVSRLAGTNAGVFIGISAHDYADMQAKDVYAADAYTNTGCALSIAANRLSYVLDLHGPSIAVDTACSSSLVAVHLACQSLWAGESSLAITGGVNCLLTPESSIGFCKATMLSPTGRCRSFDAHADGYVRSEGAGMIVLKPLADAVAARDPIYAVIVGSGVNQDGHSQGLTVPSSEAQAALLRDVYRRADINPDRVLYFEAHGTGTPVGDPLEAAAIGAALGTGRSSGNALRIGSLKTNIGHLEAAAGIAGVIKAALSIRHHALPATLHFRSPNPRIPLDDLGLRVQHELEVIAEDEPASVIGVNAFGFGGTNAHVALDRAPDIVSAGEHRGPPDQARSGYVVPLSARSPEALQAAASALSNRANSTSEPPLVLRDVCHTAGTRRTHHDHRLAVVTDSVADLVEHLAAFTRSETVPGLVSGRRSSGGRPRLAFVFSGMGPQWWAMGRQLLAADAVFRRAIEECDALFHAAAGWSLMEQLTADSIRSRMEDADVAQPANFALQMALAALWRSWGIVPDAIVGHSAGEVAAACVAGILSLEDAVNVIYHRSRLQQRTAGQGSMLAVGLSASQANAAIARFRGHVSLAAVNGPRSVTLSGDQHALEQIARTLHDMQVFAQILDTRVPYHSHHMDALKPELIGSLARLRPGPSAIPFYSVVTGDRASGLELDASYWWANIRQPVSFQSAVQKILEDRVDAFVEVSPHPVMGRSIVEIQNEREGTPVPVLASLRRDADDRQTLLAAAAKLYTLGCRIDWDGVNGGGSYVPLPLYPWQRERYWSEPERSASHRLPQVTHPLLQRRLDSVNPSWEAHLDEHRLAYLRDHVIQGAVVFPTSAYIETALAANRELTGDTPCVLEEVRFKRALILRDDDRPKIQFVVHPQDNTFSVYSCRISGEAWTLHATGRLVRDDVHAAPASRSRLRSIQSRCRQRFSSDRCYKALNAVGLQYGPSFRGIEQIWHGHREALGRIETPQELTADDNGGHIFHPAVLDACFQVISGAAFLQRDVNGNGDTYLPVEIGRCRLRRAVTGRGLWAHATLVTETQNSLRGDFVIFDDEGEVIAELTGFTCQRVPNARAAGDSLNSYLHELQWYPKTLSTVRRVRRSDYVPAVSTLARRLASGNALERQGRQEHYEKIDPQFDRLCAAYVWEALGRLGWRPRRGERVNCEKLAQRLDVVASQRSHFGRLLEILEEDGVLRKAGGDWVVANTSSVAESGTLSRAIAEHPAYEGDLVTLARCGNGLADVLRGAQDPRSLIFPEGSVAELARAYSESPYFRIYNLFVRDCVSAVVQALPKGRTIRVLEIGAGTGGTTAHVLPVLPRNRTEYLFTDVSNVFTTAARQRFADYPFIDYAMLDIDKDPLDQGLAPHSFDVVIAVDVLHAADDLRRAVTNVATLLSSNGLFLATEITRAWRLFDIDFGPLRNWRFPETDPRSARFWLSQEAWLSLLSRSGFVDTAAVSDRVPASSGIHSVLLARGPRVEGDAIVETAVRPAAAGTWVMFMDRGGVGDRIALEIERSGDTVVRVSAGDVFARTSDRHFQVPPDSVEDLTTVLRTLGELSHCRGLIHLWCLDADDLEHPGDTALNDVLERGCVNALHLIHALGRADVVGRARVWLVTRGAQRIGGETTAPRPSQALLWGLGRVVMTEQPQLHATLLDLDPDAAPWEYSHLVDELYADDVEQEIAWRADARYVLRVVPAGLASSDEVGRQRRTSDRTPPFQLEAARPGALESLRLREVQRKRPGRNEVEVEIRAAGVNFRDVMKAMGMYLDRLGEAFRFGDECAGTIVRVGEGVVDFRPGDEVIAVGPGCFGSFVTLPVDYVVRKPAELTFEQAATIPIVFLTVHYALNHVARIKKGERVLIHSAAGGVGLAAVQVAQNAGAEIFATAGSPEKRAFLTSLGIPHVMDSRSLAFAGEIMSSTGGRGLDVVLNSLAGEFLVRSLALLRPTGRFVELGKVDFYENSKLGLAPFSRGLSFLGVDLGFLLEREPAFSKQLLAEVMQMFAEGTLRPLPVRTFPVFEASSAFRFIAQARHIGKVALSMSEQPRTVVRSPRSTALFREDATYLITGGLRGFGLATAEWMVQQGARHLVLAGRSGAGSADVDAGIARLREAGAEVVAARADVSREDDVVRLLADIKRTMPPLRGVFHAAMVIDDGFLLQLDAGRFERVIGPKVRGAWHLHTHTLEQHLDFFVLFSSMASIVGSAGQGSYAAANAFLDALAHHRRAIGLPGLAVNWGAIADVGYVARNPEIGRDLQKQGILPITPAEACAILAMLLKTTRTQVGAVRLDLDHLSIVRSSESTSRRFAPILTQSQQDSETRAGATPKALLTLLAASPPEARAHLVESALRVELARVLGVRESQIDSEQPLADLGVDSLMSVELETVIRTALGIDLPLGFLVGDKVSLRHLSHRLADQSQTVTVPGPSRAAAADIPPVDAPAALAQAHS